MHRSRQTVPTAVAALVLLPLLWAGTVWADARVERPLQLQVDGFGISVGYHFGSLVYFGLTSQSGIGPVDTNYDNSFAEDDEAELYGQKGVDKSESTFGGARSAELRFSPWTWGFYFSLGYVEFEESTQEIKYDERARVIGDGAYNDTSIDATIVRQARSGGAVGFGFNHVFDQGLSFGLGALVQVDGEQDPEVTLSTNNPDVSASDLRKLEKEMRKDNRGVGLFHLAVGFNF